ncbi:hypothetical protein D3C80_1219580 [compost metagenome]
MLNEPLAGPLITASDALSRLLLRSTTWLMISTITETFSCVFTTIVFTVGGTFGDAVTFIVTVATLLLCVPSFAI